MTDEIMLRAAVTAISEKLRISGGELVICHLPPAAGAEYQVPYFLGLHAVDGKEATRVSGYTLESTLKRLGLAIKDKV